MELLSAVVSALQTHNVSFALIGAAAMAAHGVSRSTHDIDLFAVSRVCLERDAWRDVASAGAHVDVRIGDDDDPLLGVVRFSEGEQVVDLVVGRSSWQRGVIDRALPVSVFGVELPVVTPEDLVLLKLYAGGFQDRWDIQQLLQVHGHVALTDIDRNVLALPERSQALWRELRGPNAAR